MNATATRGQAKMQRQSSAAAPRANRFTLGASAVAREEQREWHAAAQVAQVLTRHGGMPHASRGRVSLLRQRIGAALVRAGDRLLTGGLLMEIARAQRADWSPRYPYPLNASDIAGGGPQ
jgi:hypothetical protein